MSKEQKSLDAFFSTNKEKKEEKKKEVLDYKSKEETNIKKIIDYYPWDITQVQYNYVDTRVQATSEGLTYAHSKGIAVVIMEPLKGGALVNPPQEVFNILNSSETKRTTVDWALQFLWNKPEISMVLSGMNSKKMIKENCKSADQSGINSLSFKDSIRFLNFSSYGMKGILVKGTNHAPYFLIIGFQRFPVKPLAILVTTVLFSAVNRLFGS